MGAHVTWEWLDKQNGVVEWVITFDNSTANEYYILNRGVKVGNKCLEVYTFGDAYYPAYLTLGMAYWVREDNLYELEYITNKDKETLPIAVVADEEGNKAVGFIFSNEVGNVLRIPEGGFVNGVEPCGAELVEVEPAGVNSYLIFYRYYMQCLQFMAQVGAIDFCEYPILAFNVLKFKTRNGRVKPLISDKIINISDLL